MVSIKPTRSKEVSKHFVDPWRRPAAILRGGCVLLHRGAKDQHVEGGAGLGQPPHLHLRPLAARGKAGSDWSVRHNPCLSLVRWWRACRSPWWSSRGKTPTPTRRPTLPPTSWARSPARGTTSRSSSWADRWSVFFSFLCNDFLMKWPHSKLAII